MLHSVRLTAESRLALIVALATLAAPLATAHAQDLPVATNETQVPAIPGAATTDPAGPSLSGDITVQPLHDAVVDPALATEADLVHINAATLPELVDQVAVPATVSPEIECLAGAVYFEARSESLAGQLAVGRVIVARTQSGRFPASYCGVVYQPSQFSFIHRSTMPAINRTSRLWQNAVKIALIAHHGAWKSPAEGALFFHAARIGPVAGKTMVTRIEHHVFYR
jgi:spore germination cell wall hydrolase CwlJ-like protein